MRERVRSDDPRLAVYLEEWREWELNQYLSRREIEENETEEEEGIDEVDG